MYLTWRERLNQSPEWGNIEAWPRIDIQTLPEKTRSGFLRNFAVVKQILDGHPLTATAHKFDLNPSRVSQLLSRALAGEDDEFPPLTSGLIPFQRLASSKRRLPLPELGTRGGNANAFQHLLHTVPGLQKHLDALIKSAARPRKHEQFSTVQSCHKSFIDYLQGANWPLNRYPFSTRSLAYEAVRRYYNRRLADFTLPSPRATRVIRGDLTKQHALEYVEIDGHQVDLTTQVYLVMDDVEIPLPLPRVHLYCAVDIASDMILAAHVSLSKTPNQFDLLFLLERMVGLAPARALLTPGLTYPPKPFAVVDLPDYCQTLAPDTIKLDNAYAHHALRVREFICNRLGATLSLGIPAAPKSRQAVEYAFKRIAEMEHRFPSTTGSHVRDRRRQKRLAKAPMLNLKTFEETIEVFVAEHNQRQQARLGGLSPIQWFENNIGQRCPRLLPSELRYDGNPFQQTKVVPVKCNLKERRLPYVNFFGDRYSSPELRALRPLPKTVTVTYDWRDIRCIKAYTSAGQPLGEMRGPRSWMHFPHSVLTRRHIRDAVKAQRFKDRDPLGGYFKYLVENKHIPKFAQELIRVYREFSPEGNPIDVPVAESRIKPHGQLSQLGRFKPWSPRIAGRG